MRRIAELYEEGKELPQDDTLAFFWFSQAGLRGDHDSELDAGRLLQKLPAYALDSIRKSVLDWKPISGEEPFKTLMKRGEELRLVAGRPGAEESDHRHRLRARCKRPRNGRTSDQRDELAAPHVWMAPAWQEIIWRAAQRSPAVMGPACWCSPVDCWP